MNEDRIKINVRNGDAYRILVRVLKEARLTFHSYKNKQERPIRVMIKHLHYSYNIERIKNLRAKNLKIIDVTNKISWKFKKSLDIFILIFNNEENIDKIYKITNILGC